MINRTPYGVVIVQNVDVVQVPKERIWKQQALILACLEFESDMLDFDFNFPLIDS